MSGDQPLNATIRGLLQLVDYTGNSRTAVVLNAWIVPARKAGKMLAGGYDLTSDIGNVYRRLG